MEASDTDGIRHGRHCIFQMRVHLVFVARYRRTVFDGEALEALRAIFSKVCADFGATLVEMSGEEDYVHLLVEYPPKVPVSSLVNSLKGVSSRLLHQRQPGTKPRYWNGVLWSPSYLAASAGEASLAVVRRFMDRQKIPQR